MLATHAQRDAGPCGTPELAAHAHELGNALVDRLERVPRDDVALEVGGQHLALDVIAREAQRRLREVVRAKAEEVRVAGDAVGHDGGARQLDHGAHGNLAQAHARLDLDVDDGALHDGAHLAYLCVEAHERHHDVRARVLALALEAHRGAGDGARLQHGQLGEGKAQAAAAKAQHRVCLGQRVDAREKGAGARDLIGACSLALHLGEANGQVAGVVEELVQRRVKQADRHGQAVHGVEDLVEVALLRA